MKFTIGVNNIKEKEGLNTKRFTGNWHGDGLQREKVACCF